MALPPLTLSVAPGRRGRPSLTLCRPSTAEAFSGAGSSPSRHQVARLRRSTIRFPLGGKALFRNFARSGLANEDSQKQTFGAVLLVIGLSFYEWRLWPTTRRRAPRSECPLQSKHPTLIVVARAAKFRRQFLPPNSCGFTPPLAPLRGAGEARPLEIAFNRAVRPADAPRCPVVEFDLIRTHFACRRSKCLRNIVAVSSPAALSPATVPGLFGGGSVSLLRTAH